VIDSVVVARRLSGPLQRATKGVGRLFERLPLPESWSPGLDPDLRALLLGERLLHLPKLPDHPPAKARRVMLAEFALVDAAPPPGITTEEAVAVGPGGRIPLRLYRSAGVRPGGPALIWFHGGGFVVGDLESHDSACRRLAHALDATVIAAHYRLAPEHPFPASWDDALAVFDAVRARATEFGIDPARIAIGGDSAGGNLSASVALARRGKSGPALQILLYAATDFTGSFPSRRQFAEGYVLDDQLIAYFSDHTIPKPLRKDPRASPWFAPDLTDVAPALVVTAGFDPLRDEGEAFAQRLRAAGVSAEVRREAPMVHGYLTMVGVSRGAEAAVDWLHQEIRRRLEALPACECGAPCRPNYRCAAT
jgi:acetyl esterase